MPSDFVVIELFAVAIVVQDSIELSFFIISYNLPSIFVVTKFLVDLGSNR